MRGKGKENQEISVLGRLVSLEALIFIMGAVSLIYGLFTASLLHIIIGALIVTAAFFVGRRCRWSYLTERYRKGRQR